MCLHCGECGEQRKTAVEGKWYKLEDRNQGWMRKGKKWRTPCQKSDRGKRWKLPGKCLWAHSEAISKEFSTTRGMLSVSSCPTNLITAFNSCLHFQIHYFEPIWTLKFLQQCKLRWGKALKSFLEIQIINLSGCCVKALLRVYILLVSLQILSL